MRLWWSLSNTNGSRISNLLVCFLRCLGKKTNPVLQAITLLQENGRSQCHNKQLFHSSSETTKHMSKIRGRREFLHTATVTTLEEAALIPSSSSSLSSSPVADVNHNIHSQTSAFRIPSSSGVSSGRLLVLVICFFRAESAGAIRSRREIGPANIIWTRYNFNLAIAWNLNHLQGSFSFQNIKKNNSIPRVTGDLALGTLYCPAN